MLYIKIQLKNHIEIKVDLYEDEIFTTCPGCQKEVQVDTETLVHVLQDGDFCSTQVFCDRCSTEIKESN